MAPSTPWTFLAVFVLLPALAVLVAILALNAHLFLILGALVWAGMGLTLAPGALTGESG
ncbi:MAG TPA: hypothetical protein VM889_11230 [Candidatus Thermoplasmatota archaeon]|jgi:hypothetical protein|nr:hypothetical protein [Candidatus Thermoplasmatota archaeon]